MTFQPSHEPTGDEAIAYLQCCARLVEAYGSSTEDFRNDHVTKLRSDLRHFGQMRSKFTVAFWPASMRIE
jgi:hypothetical protein